jgi:hypothetical protein
MALTVSGGCSEAVSASPWRETLGRMAAKIDAIVLSSRLGRPDIDHRKKLQLNPRSVIKTGNDLEFQPRKEREVID